MEQPLFTTIKVNNEIELCEISDPECKQLIERELLKERISYFIRWVKPSIVRRYKNSCIICVNENAKDAAENVVRAVCDEKVYTVRFLMKRSQKQYF